MYPLHLAGALSRAEDPRAARNRANLLALREAREADRRTIKQFRPWIQIRQFAFAGGSTSPSADAGVASPA